MNTIKKNTKARKNSLSGQQARESKIYALMRQVFDCRKIFGAVLIGGAVLFGMAGSSSADTIYPRWDTPIIPHYNGEPDENGNTQYQSGYIHLGSGSTYTQGYNGSDLRYYFNDEDDKDDEELAWLIADLAAKSANMATAIAAGVIAAVDPLAGPGTKAVSAIQVVIATYDETVSAYNLATFEKWDEQFVGGIDYNSSLTVEGYGTLTGVYQNVETLLLTNGGTVNLSGAGSAIQVVDYLKSSGSLNLGAGTEAFAIGTMNIAGTLTNAGQMSNIGSISAATITNSGDMLGIGSITGNLTNQASGKVMINNYKGTTLNNAGDFFATTLVDAQSTINSGTFTSAGAMIGGTLNNSGTLTTLSTVNMTGALTNSGTWNALGLIQGASLTNSDTLNVGSDLIITGAINNAGGTITGFGAASSVKSGSINAGTVQNMISVITGSVTGKTDFNDIETLTVGTRGVNGGNIFAGGDLVGIDKVTIYGNATFDNIYVTGNTTNPAFGEGSVYKVTGSISGYNDIIGVETLIVGSTQNATGSKIIGTGDGAKYTTGTLSGATVGSAHAGTVAGYQYVQINNALTNAASGIIQGTGIGSKLQMIGTNGTTLYDLNNSGTISNFAYVATKNLTNNAGGDIIGSGPGSMYEIGWIEDVKLNTGQRGDLVNNGSIYNIEKLLVTGTVVNNSEIYGSGKGSLMTVNSLGNGYGQTDVVLTNTAGNIISGYERMDVDGAVYNGIGSAIVGTGKGSVYIFNGELKNDGVIYDVETLSFIGNIGNNADGLMTGAGAGSKIETPNLANAGLITGYEKADIVFDLDNTGIIVSTGNGSVWNIGEDLTNRGDGTTGGVILDVAQFNIGSHFFNTGRVATTGGDSIINIAGSLYNGFAPSPGPLPGPLAAPLPPYNGANAIVGYEQINVTGNIFNMADYSIIGTGYGSRITGDQSLINAGLIGDYEKMKLAGNLINTGMIVSTGKGSIFNIEGAVTNDGDGTTSGVIADVEKFLIDDYLRNGGLIQGTGSGSILEVRGNGSFNGYTLVNGQDISSANIAGTIRNYESILVNGSVLNTATGVIQGANTWRNSEFNATGSLDNLGLIQNYQYSNIGWHLTNDGTIFNVAELTVGGHLRNGGLVQGTGVGSLLEVKGLFAPLPGGYTLVNGQDAAGTNIAGTISNYESILVGGSVLNTATGHIAGTGVLNGIGTGHNSEFSATGVLLNQGAITNYQYSTIGQDVTNTGLIMSVGAGSVYNYGGNMTNSGNFYLVEQLNLTGNLVNTGGITSTGKGSVYNVGGYITNDNTISSIAEFTLGGYLRNGGLVQGTGIGSILEINGTSSLGGYTLINGQDTTGTNVAGTISDYESVLVRGSVLNTAASYIVGTGVFNGLGTGHNSEFKATGNLVNDGIIANYQYSTIGGNVTNTGRILSVGAGSVYNYGGNMNNSGDLYLVEKLNLVGNLTNTGDIASTGKGSVYNVGGNLTNDVAGANTGVIREVAQLTVNGNMRNGGTVATTGGDSILNVRGTLINGQNAVGANIAGVISGYQEMTVNGGVLNTASGDIVSTGKGSTYRFIANGSLPNGDALENHGRIIGVENLASMGNVVNTNLISATSASDTHQADGPYSSFVVHGNFENGTVPGAMLTNWQAESIATPGDDIREEHRAEYPAIQSINDLSARTDVAYLLNYSNLEVSGTVNNRDNGFIQATGVGSTYTMGALNNAGVVNDVETLNINGTNNPSAFQVAVNGTVGDHGWNHDGNIYGRINSGVAANAGDLVNRAGGLIVGTGNGSTLNVAGNVYNMYGSTIRNFENANIGGSLANEGFLEFIQDTRVDGDFVNTAVYQAGNNAVGGVMLTDTYNGRIGKITVQGDATINGGELWIGGSGEQLAVGQDYTFLTVNDGHLTVNERLQIRAINEYGYDTLLGDNYSPRRSSNVTASAVPRLFHAEGFYTDTDYYVSLRRDYVYGVNGETTNERKLGVYLDSIAYTLNSTADNYTQGDLFNVLSALDNENIKAVNVPANDYGYSVANDTGYTYVANYASAGALDAIEQMTGTLYADTGMMAMQNSWFVKQQLANHLRPSFCVQCNQCNSGPIVNCNCVCETTCPTGFGHNAWGMYYGNTGRISSDGNARGFNYHNNGAILGADMFNNVTTRLGIYGSFGNSRLATHDMHQRVDTDSYEIGIYGVREFCFGNLMGVANVGRNSHQSKRLLAFGQWDGNSNYVRRMHQADFKSTQASVRLEQSWNYAHWNTVFQPFVAGSYTHLQMDGLQEYTSWGDRADRQYVTELNNHDYELDSLRSELGLRMSRCLVNYCNARVVNIHGHASWVHEFADTNTTISNSFTNKNYDAQQTGYNSAYNTVANNAFNSDQYNVTSYNVTGVDLGRDYVWAGIGTTCTNLCKNATVFGAYDVFANHHSVLHNGSLGVQFDW